MTEEEAIEKLYDAWTDEGVNPRYHREVQKKLAAEWPTLYHAMEQFAKAKRLAN